MEIPTRRFRCLSGEVSSADHRRFGVVGVGVRDCVGLANAFAPGTQMGFAVKCGSSNLSIGPTQ